MPRPGSLVALALTTITATCTTPPAPSPPPTAPSFRHDTPLHEAALRRDVAAVHQLLAAGASATARNDDGATPLHFATGELEVVRALLAAGAEVDARMGNGATALAIAVAREASHAVASELLRAGASPAATIRDSFGNDVPVLILALEGGDPATLHLLLQQPQLANDRELLGEALVSAAFQGDRPALERLLAAGADVNHQNSFSGHALNVALYGGHAGIAATLIARGADLTRRSGAATAVPPMVWSAYDEGGDAAVAQLLLARGVDPDATASTGETARRWAEKRGETELTRLLRERGALDAGPARKRKEPPARELPADDGARAGRRRAALERALPLLQQASDGFLANGFAKQTGCVSCHHQTLPAVAFGMAQERGYALDAAALARQVAAQVRSWQAGIGNAYALVQPQPDAPANLGYGLLGLHALRHEHDDLSEAMAWYLVESQRRDGSWESNDRRPPMEQGAIVGTALAVGALRVLPPRRSARALDDVLATARQWLAQQQPRSRNEQLFVLAGLGWAGADLAERRRRAAAVVALQQADGGFAPFPTTPADPWTTALAAFALREAGMADEHAASLRRAGDWLLQNQLADGSWWQESRSWPLQPHFDSGFPHGKDQWIAAGATALAAIVLLAEEPATVARDGLPSAQHLLAGLPSALATPPPGAAPAAAAGAGLGFAADIEPMLRTSCRECHSGERPKGGFDVTTRERLLAGGHSGEPAVVPGRPEQSPLLRYVRDQVEDLEMPPLHRRDRFPALTAAQVATLRDWVQAGAR